MIIIYKTSIIIGIILEALLVAYYATFASTICQSLGKENEEEEKKY